MNNWKKVKLKQVLKQYKNIHRIEDSKEYSQVTISQNGEVYIRGKKKGSEIGRKRQFFVDLEEHPDTLIFIRQGVYKGGIGLAPSEVDGCTVTENMPMFEVVDIDPQFLVQYFKSKKFKEDLSKIVPLGTAQKAIHERQLLELEIPLPPKEEQIKIRGKIGNDNSKIEKFGNLQTSSLSLIQKLRQKILQEAVQGKLTEQNPNDEPASELLKKIKKEKDKLIKEGKIKKQKPLPEITEDEIPYELPNNWCWTRLGDVGTWAQGTGFPKIHQGNQNKEDILFCKVSDMNLVGNEKFIVKTQNTINRDSAKTIHAKIHPKNTIIFPKIGGAIATNKRRILSKETIIDNNCSGLIPYSEIDLWYLFLLFNRFDFTEYQSGTSTPALNQSKLGNILIPLPPLAEQQRIVEKVDKLMAVCDELEKRVKENQQNSERLMQAVLGEVF